jgi:peptide deformylase
VPDFVIYPDPRLFRGAMFRPLDAELLATGKRLREAAEAVQAYGLAAAHIGEIEPVAVISTAADPAARDYVLLFNPEIIAVAEITAFGPEASVSMPGIEVPVERPVWAEIGYDDEGGERRMTRFEGFVARCALHEIEQVNGMFFLSRLSRLKRDTAIRKFQKSNRAD